MKVKGEGMGMGVLSERLCFVCVYVCVCTGSVALLDQDIRIRVRLVCCVHIARAYHLFESISKLTSSSPLL